jgi:hypothetical protein
MKKVIDCTQEVFSKRDTRASSQLFSYYLIIGSRAKGLATKYKFLKPHIQKGNMLPVANSPLFLVLSNITRPSPYVLCLQLVRRCVILTAKKSIRRRNI